MFTVRAVKLSGFHSLLVESTEPTRFQANSCRPHRAAGQKLLRAFSK
jgi:hypothetical protein